MPDTTTKPKRILAIASGGGHFIQLRRLRPAWEDCQVRYVSTLDDYANELEPGVSYRRINDGNRDEWFKVLLMAIRVGWTVIAFRPDVVVSTGAAPGYFALRFGKLIGAKTIWIDSIANAGELSMTGRMAKRHADLWLTQWAHLADAKGPHYKGSVV